MKAARLEVLFGMIIATSSLGARGLACGPCGGTTVDVMPVLPPSDGSDAGTDAGDFLAEACETMCHGEECEPTTLETADGEVPAIRCTTRVDCSAGRRPRGLCAHTPASPASGDATAAWLAEMAFLEAASIDAFRLLRRDLAALGAPRKLLGAATRAARDERRHARRMTALARRRGSAPERPRIGVTTPPSLEELATQNAVEGCVRETFGALVARVQAREAADREIGAALSRIAREEARHAALSWQIDAWARRRLTRDARERVDRAREAAARAVIAEAARPVPAALVRDTGHPDRARAEELARAMCAALGLLPRAA
jgi:hypothetical protein